MPREIRFRGKRVDNGKWVYGGISINGNIVYIIEKIFIHDVITAEVIPETVGQFTGLKDADDTEIYENDILFDEHCEEMYVVGFDEGKFIGSDNTIQFDLCDLYESVLIGNIHDDPELLENIEEV